MTSMVYIFSLDQQVALAGGISIKNLVPALKEGIQNLRRFVYKGSLPTPPCYESVTWVIFRRPINLVPERVSLFLFQPFL